MLKKKLLLISFMVSSLIGCTTIDLNNVNLNKNPEYPTNYEVKVNEEIKPYLKEFNTETFYRVSEPHKIEYKLSSTSINSQIVNGYGVCYMVASKNELGSANGNKIFLFIFDGDRLLHSTHETVLNVIENSRIYNTCGKMQKLEKF